jgi:hypothetical protein
MKRALGIVGLGLVLGLVGLLSGCDALLAGPEDSYEQEAALPPESYEEPPHRNEEITTKVNFSFGFEVSDYRETKLDYEAQLMSDLNTEGKKNGNTFVAPRPGRNPMLIINVMMYCDSNPNAETHHLRYVTEFWAFGHRDMVARITTTDTSDRSHDFLFLEFAKIAEKLNSWMSTGWHTKDFDR